MTTPQARWNARRRAERVAAGKCRTAAPRPTDTGATSAGRARRRGRENGGNGNDETVAAILEFLNGMGVSINLDRVRVSLGDGEGA